MLCNVVIRRSYDNLRNFARKIGVLRLRQPCAWRNFAVMRSPEATTPDATEEPNELLSVTQAGAELRLSPRAVLHRIHGGKIAATKLGPGTAGYVITRDEVERVKREDAA